MSQQITGRAKIRIDGAELETLPGATLNPGGANRKAMKGNGRIYGFNEEDVEPSIECKIAHKKGLSLKALSSLTEATITFETDTGVFFLLRGGFTTEPCALSSDSGEVALKMAAISCDEV